ncbi:MAG: YeeE/YedE family protein [Myxococcales bacterium]|nr:YeeE/YedE family protein [Myxococcales bacterium]
MLALFAPALIGGALIGLSASLFLLTHGKVAGISGLYGGLLQPAATGHAERVAFVAGLLVAGLVLLRVHPVAFATSERPTAAILVAGLLVGVGTRLGNGCTSGHGVCGISRFSVRSLVATVTFLGAGALTVLVTRHAFGVLR